MSEMLSSGGSDMATSLESSPRLGLVVGVEAVDPLLKRDICCLPEPLELAFMTEERPEGLYLLGRLAIVGACGNVRWGVTGGG